MGCTALGMIDELSQHKEKHLKILSKVLSPFD
jgi:hypothetical protein